MADRRIDPFKYIGSPGGWGSFGDGAQDAACDAERRAMCDHFLRRLQKAERRGNSGTAELLTGGMVAFAGLFVSAGGGPDQLDAEAFEKWIGIATFSWYQSIACYDGGTVQ